jgi:hypothetical protein
VIWVWPNDSGRLGIHGWHQSEACYRGANACRCFRHCGKGDPPDS